MYLYISRIAEWDGDFFFAAKSGINVSDQNGNAFVK